MANQDLATLRREREKQEAGLSNTTAQIAAIEAEEKRQRDETERKQREAESLQRKREGFKRWISSTEMEITDLKARAARQVDSACEDQGPGLFALKDTLRELAVAELQMDALREYEAAALR